jgi:hypothetical protein
MIPLSFRYSLTILSHRVDDKSAVTPSSRNKVSIDREAKLGTGTRGTGTSTRKRGEEEYDMET